MAREGARALGKGIGETGGRSVVWLSSGREEKGEKGVAGQCKCCEESGGKWGPGGGDRKERRIGK